MPTLLGRVPGPASALRWSGGQPGERSGQRRPDQRLRRIAAAVRPGDPRPPQYRAAPQCGDYFIFLSPHQTSGRSPPNTPPNRPDHPIAVRVSARGTYPRMPEDNVCQPTHVLWQEHHLSPPPRRTEGKSSLPNPETGATSSRLLSLSPSGRGLFAMTCARRRMPCQTHVGARKSSGEQGEGTRTRGGNTLTLRA